MERSTPTADLAQQPIVWRPDAERLRRSRMLAFARHHGLHNYDSLVERAARDPEWFWGAIDEELDLRWTTPYTRVLDLARGPAWPRWFVDGRMNYVTSAVDRYLEDRPNATALVWEGDDGATQELTYSDLAARVNQLANGLRTLGVGVGDRVAIYLPMLVETAVATLACGKIGAIFVPIFSGYGADATANRINDAGAKLLITADGFYRRGRVINMKTTADQACALTPSIESVLVVRRTGQSVTWNAGRDVWWDALAAQHAEQCEPADTAADDPYMLIYTSGTTGRPKGAVHIHAGFPVKAAQDLAFCFDLQRGDRLCWITDLGWMMGPWMIAGGLIAGASLLLYEGTPDYPEPDRLWQVVERHDVTVLGISPTLVRALMGRGDAWADAHSMPSLRALGSTGEPWNPGPWRWAFEHVGKSRCPIVNYSGGTEIAGGIVSATTIHPQKPCAFVGPVPGVPADVVDAAGVSVRRGRRGARHSRPLGGYDQRLLA